MGCDMHVEAAGPAAVGGISHPKLSPVRYCLINSHDE